MSMELSPQNPPQSLSGIGEAVVANAPPLPIDSVEALVKAVQAPLKEFTDLRRESISVNSIPASGRFRRNVELETKRLTNKSQERLRADLGVGIGAIAVLILTGYRFGWAETRPRWTC